jgi:hypothetical protein
MLEALLHCSIAAKFKCCSLNRFLTCGTLLLRVSCLQYDRHLPVLTVAETMEFAHACAGKRPDFISKQELKEV